MVKKCYILQDKSGKVVTDEEGFVRIWFSRKQAEKDANELNQTKGLSLKVIAVGTDFLLKSPLSEEERIVISEPTGEKEIYVEDLIGETEEEIEELNKMLDKGVYAIKEADLGSYTEQAKIEKPIEQPEGGSYLPGVPETPETFLPQPLFELYKTHNEIRAMVDTWKTFVYGRPKEELEMQIKMFEASKNKLVRDLAKVLLEVYRFNTAKELVEYLAEKFMEKIIIKSDELYNYLSRGGLFSLIESKLFEISETLLKSENPLERRAGDLLTKMNFSIRVEKAQVVGIELEREAAKR